MTHWSSPRQQQQQQQQQQQLTYTIIPPGAVGVRCYYVWSVFWCATSYNVTVWRCDGVMVWWYQGIGWHHQGYQTNIVTTTIIVNHQAPIRTNNSHQSSVRALISHFQQDKVSWIILLPSVLVSQSVILIFQLKIIMFWLYGVLCSVSEGGFVYHSPEINKTF